MPGSRTVPKGSMCLNGLSVTRPSRAAVSSPRSLATSACAPSWKVMASSTGRIQTENRWIAFAVAGVIRPSIAQAGSFANWSWATKPAGGGHASGGERRHEGVGFRRKSAESTALADNDLGADPDAAIEVDDILVAHADAA